jgi:hypothetical protein
MMLVRPQMSAAATPKMSGASPSPSAACPDWHDRRVWRVAIGRDPTVVPASGEVEKIRRIIHLELVVFISIPLVAGLMARGTGS